MAIVERYHAPIQRALKVVFTEAADLGKGEALKMAVKAINDSDGQTPSTFKRTIALQKATKEMPKHFTSRQF